MQALELIDKMTQNATAKTHLLKVLDAFQQLDYHALNDLLDNDCYFQDVTKTAFIYKQKQIFNYFSKQGDTAFSLSTNICTSCLCSEPVFILTGNTSGLKYAIYIKFLKDDIVDMYRCFQQSDFMLVT